MLQWLPKILAVQNQLHFSYDFWSKSHRKIEHYLHCHLIHWKAPRGVGPLLEKQLNTVLKKKNTIFKLFDSHQNLEGWCDVAKYSNTIFLFTFCSIVTQISNVKPFPLFSFPFICAAVRKQDEVVINRTLHTTLSNYIPIAIIITFVFKKKISIKSSNVVFDMRSHVYSCIRTASSEPRNSIIKLLLQTIFFLYSQKAFSFWQDMYSSAWYLKSKERCVVPHA